MPTTSWVGLTSSGCSPRSDTESCSSGFCFACMIPLSVGYRGSLTPAVTVTKAGSSHSTTSYPPSVWRSIRIVPSFASTFLANVALGIPSSSATVIGSVPV